MKKLSGWDMVSLTIVLLFMIGGFWYLNEQARAELYAFPPMTPEYEEIIDTEYKIAKDEMLAMLRVETQIKGR